MEAGEGRVHRDDAQPTHHGHGVLRLVGVDPVEAPGECSALVVVPARHDDRRTEPFRDRLDDLAEERVGLRLPLVGEITGQDECVEVLGRLFNADQRLAQLSHRVDVSVQEGVPGDEVHVAQVRDDVGRCGLASGRDHEESVCRTAASGALTTSVTCRRRARVSVCGAAGSQDTSRASGRRGPALGSGGHTDRHLSPVRL